MLRLSLKSSRRLAVVLVSGFVAAAAAVHLADFGGRFGTASELAAYLGLAGACWWHVRRDALLRAPGAIREVVLHDDGRLDATCRDGRVISGTQQPGGHASRWLATIRYLPEEGRLARVVLVMPDNLSPDEFRRLRVWLRWRRPEEAPRL